MRQNRSHEINHEDIRVHVRVSGRHINELSRRSGVTYSRALSLVRTFSMMLPSGRYELVRISNYPNAKRRNSEQDGEFLLSARLGDTRAGLVFCGDEFFNGSDPC